MKKPEICQRTRTAREKAGFDQKDMPGQFSLYGIEVTSDAYNKYETRTPIRQSLIPIFCKITGIDEKWLLTGVGPMADETDEFLSIMRQIDDPALKDKLKTEALRLLLLTKGK